MIGLARRGRRSLLLGATAGGARRVEALLPPLFLVWRGVLHTRWEVYSFAAPAAFNFALGFIV